MNDWISVNDKMPDDETVVLVFAPEDKSEPVWLGYFVSELNVWSDPTGAYIDEEITHWMPLPEPPNVS